MGLFRPVAGQLYYFFLSLPSFCVVGKNGFIFKEFFETLLKLHVTWLFSYTSVDRTETQPAAFSVELHYQVVSKSFSVLGHGHTNFTFFFFSFTSYNKPKFKKLLTKYHSGDQVKKTEMGRACGTYEGEERCIQGFSGET
jgi:hypothetical protein